MPENDSPPTPALLDLLRERPMLSMGCSVAVRPHNQAESTRAERLDFISVSLVPEEQLLDKRCRIQLKGVEEDTPTFWDYLTGEV